VIREFHTKNFRVTVEALPEYDLDLSWDEDGETAKGLESGELIAFCAHAYVVHRPTGQILAEDFLGNCVYKSLDDFMDHRECGKQNREWEKPGKTGRCGSYFSDMIAEAIGEARKQLVKMKQTKVRLSA